MLGGEVQKFLVVVNVVFSPVAEEQPKLLVLMARRIGQQPMQHGTERSDTGAGGDEDGIAQRWTQDEIAERPLAGDVIALFHVAEKIRHEAVLYPVEAESESGVLSGR